MKFITGSFKSASFHVYVQLTKAEIYCKKFGSNPRLILAPQSFTEVIFSMQPGHSGILERYAALSNYHVCLFKYTFV